MWKPEEHLGGSHSLFSRNTGPGNSAQDIRLHSNLTSWASSLGLDYFSEMVLKYYFDIGGFFFFLR